MTRAASGKGAAIVSIHRDARLSDASAWGRLYISRAKNHMWAKSRGLRPWSFAHHLIGVLSFVPAVFVFPHFLSGESFRE